MTLPFLKNQKEGSMSSEVESEVKDFGALDAVVDDLESGMGIKFKDKALLKSALESLVEFLKIEDEEQDQQLLDKE